MTIEECKALADLLDRHVAKLAEHFEAVQIVACITHREGTRSFNRGSGNWFARLEMARQFINNDARIEQAQRIAERVNPPDEGETWKQ
jgi:hypothetical protein